MSERQDGAGSLRPVADDAPPTDPALLPRHGAGGGDRPHPLAPTPGAAGRGGPSLDEALRALAEVTVGAEDELLSGIPILGEPEGQRAVDDWVDQAVDTLRALGEAADELISRRSLP